MRLICEVMVILRFLHMLNAAAFSSTSYQLVTFIYDFVYAKCYVIHIVLDRIKDKIKSTVTILAIA